MRDINNLNQSKMSKSYISSEEILKEISEIGSFKGYIDGMSGTLEWWDKERDITILATPNWETEGEVPFDVDKGDGDEIWNVCTIKMIDGTKSEQFVHYLNVLMMIMNHYEHFNNNNK
jgi:hypothetical protein